MRVHREVRRLSGLRLAQVDELIADVALRQENHRIFYLVDPYEIFDFCFPISPDPARQQTHKSIDQIADEQTALHTLFFLSETRPIVTSEYEREIQAISHYLHHLLQRVYMDAAFVDAMINRSPLRSQDLEQGASDETVVTRIGNAFNVVLAVNLGLYSIGVRRFTNLLGSRLDSASLHGAEPLAADMFRTYRPGPIAAAVFDALSSDAKHDAGYRTEYDRLKRERNDHADAAAIDRILQLNRALEEAYTCGKLNHRHVFLYVSTAQKSARVFRLQVVRDAQPEINDKPFSVLRTREQLVAQVGCLEHGGPRAARLARTRQKLLSLREVVNELGALRGVFADGMRKECSECILQGGATSSCEWLRFCERLKPLAVTLYRDEEVTKNLGLVESVQAYKTLLSRAVAEKRSYLAYRGFLRTVLSDRQIRDAVLEKAGLQHELILASARFTRGLPDMIASVQPGEREGRDIVTGTAQYVPRRPCFRPGTAYAHIADEIVAFWATPDASRERFIEVYDKYAALEARGVPEIERGEHELVRCLFYLASPSRESDEAAWVHSQLVADRFPSVRGDALYIAIWAGRRTAHYQHTEAIAAEACRRWQKDPRFFHGRALNTFAWLRDGRRARFCRRGMREVLRDATQALALYMQTEPRDKEMIAVLHNDLSYFYCYAREKRGRLLPESPRRLRPERADIERAREHLSELKRWQPREGWTIYPEYHHTEAFVEFLEYRELKERQRPEGELRAKLENARGSIAGALERYAKKEYRSLSEDIGNELDALAAGMPRSLLNKA